MGIYDQAPQMYGSMLQGGLDKQFQLATQAQPVTQFLAGLRQAQALKMQQQQMERQSEQDAWQQQKFEEQQAWNRERTGIEDSRYRDNMELNHQAAAERQSEIKRQNAAVAQEQFRNKFSKQSRGGEADFPMWDANAQAAGVDLRAEGLAEDTILPEAGPYTEDIPEPTRKVTMLKEGGEWRAMVDAKAEKARQAEEDRRAKFEDKLTLLAASRQGGAGGPNYAQQLAREKYDDKKAEEFKVKNNAFVDVDNGLAELENETKKLAEHPGLAGVTGQIEGRTEAMDWTSGDRSEARAKFKEIKARILINVLTTMKMATKTGASGFGSLSLPEQQAIENSMAALSLTQDEDSLKRELLRLSNWAKTKRDRLAGDAAGSVQKEAGPGKPSKQERYEALRESGKSASAARATMKLEGY